jgi:RHH-type proline utilization regulon transcriptional repressor/proline dehydrogenase/delta 1-pyrroline-5-carboxylate dehydrogenase
VIDEEARNMLEKHLVYLQETATIHKRDTPTVDNALPFGPVVAEIPLSQLPDREVFARILHIVRYRAGDLETCAGASATKGYGLTLGVHSRLQSFVHKVRTLVPADNVYVNRSIISAVLGVQPFGGQGLSGAGLMIPGEGAQRSEMIVPGIPG